MVDNVDGQDTLGDIARDLPELGGRLGSMKDEALARLYSPEYDTLRLRLDVAHAAVEAAAVEARRRMRLSEGSEGECKCFTLPPQGPLQKSPGVDSGGRSMAHSWRRISR